MSLDVKVQTAIAVSVFTENGRGRFGKYRLSRIYRIPWQQKEEDLTAPVRELFVAKGPAGIERVALRWLFAFTKQGLAGLDGEHAATANIDFIGVCCLRWPVDREASQPAIGARERRQNGFRILARTAVGAGFYGCKCPLCENFAIQSCGAP